jgi:hypothetical protein
MALCPASSSACCTAEGGTRGAAVPLTSRDRGGDTRPDRAAAAGERKQYD